jgi:hypothetical protein
MEVDAHDTRLGVVAKAIASPNHAQNGSHNSSERQQGNLHSSLDLTGSASHQAQKMRRTYIKHACMAKHELNQTKKQGASQGGCLIGHRNKDSFGKPKAFEAIGPAKCDLPNSVMPNAVDLDAIVVLFAHTLEASQRRACQLSSCMLLH